MQRRRVHSTEENRLRFMQEKREGKSKGVLLRIEREVNGALKSLPRYYILVTSNWMLVELESEGQEFTCHEEMLSNSFITRYLVLNVDISADTRLFRVQVQYNGEKIQILLRAASAEDFELWTTGFKRLMLHKKNTYPPMATAPASYALPKTTSGFPLIRKKEPSVEKKTKKIPPKEEKKFKKVEKTKEEKKPKKEKVEKVPDKVEKLKKAKSMQDVPSSFDNGTSTKDQEGMASNSDSMSRTRNVVAAATPGAMKLKPRDHNIPPSRSVKTRNCSTSTEDLALRTKKREDRRAARDAACQTENKSKRYEEPKSASSQTEKPRSISKLEEFKVSQTDAKSRKYEESKVAASHSKDQRKQREAAATSTEAKTKQDINDRRREYHRQRSSTVATATPTQERVSQTTETISQARPHTYYPLEPMTPPVVLYDETAHQKKIVPTTRNRQDTIDSIYGHSRGQRSRNNTMESVATTSSEAALRDKLRALMDGTTSPRGSEEKPTEEELFWRYGEPDYTHWHREYVQGRSVEHDPESLEEQLHVLLQQWEKDSVHVILPSLRESIQGNDSTFFVQINDGPQLSPASTSSVPHLGLLHAISERELEGGHAYQIASAFEYGMQFEILDIVSTGEHISFSWRQWGTYNGTFLGTRGHSQVIQIQGFCSLALSSTYTLLSLRLWCNVNHLWNALLEASVIAQMYTEASISPQAIETSVPNQKLDEDYYGYSVEDISDDGTSICL